MLCSLLTRSLWVYHMLDCNRQKLASLHFLHVVSNWSSWRWNPVHCELSGPVLEAAWCLNCCQGRLRTASARQWPPNWNRPLRRSLHLCRNLNLHQHRLLSMRWPMWPMWIWGPGHGTSIVWPRISCSTAILLLYVLRSLYLPIPQVDRSSATVPSRDQ